MTPAQFKDYQKTFKWRVKTTAEKLGVTRYAVMHWRAGRREIPRPVAILLTKYRDELIWFFQR
jgi:plasmid maintenance system antidote protein VapI